jgi:succinate-semialdehyde dehydrogenase/glutarate-semialdehyde dehydrogenase
MKTDLYINGQWIKSDHTAVVIDPSDGSEIAHVSYASEAHCEAAVTAAHEAFPAWAATSPRVRAEMLRKTYEIMVAESDRLAKILSKENGKIYGDALNEVMYAAEFFRWFSEETVRITGDFRKSPSGDKRILVTHQPIGVSLLITPWNFPTAMVSRKIAPALAAGCTVVLKPASETPLSAIAVVEILERAGVPAGVVNYILPSSVGSMISRILHDPRVRNLSFTGSTQVGRILIKECADNVLRTSMELGGNAPVIIFDDANLETTVAGVMIAKMRNGGAACTSANRIYVHRSVAEKFTSEFSKAMSNLKVGPGLSQGVQLGASVSIKERDKIAALVDQAISEGGTIHAGGAIPDGDGAFYPATVLTVAKDNSILENEIFGPVAPLIIFDNDDEAIALANDTPYGLIAYVFTEDLKRGIKVAEALESGMVAINRGVISDPAAPFGGFKQSGLGREGGFDGIHEFLETKYIGVEI